MSKLPNTGGALALARIEGIDISAWQGDVDFAQVAKAGYRFAYMKATEGLSYVSPRFAPEWADAKAHGLLRGAYHFFHPLKDPVAQAELFVKTMGPIGPGDLPPVLDFEGYSGIAGIQKPDAFVENALLWLKHVWQLTGRKPLLYLGPSFWKYRVSPAKFASMLFEYQLWEASYGSKPRPMPWTNGLGGEPWTIWQCSGSGIVPGVVGRCDLNVFAGNEDELRALACLPPLGVAA